jgi:hypothetical protein
MLSHSRRRRDTKVVFLLGTSEAIVCHWVCAHGRKQIKSFLCLQGIQTGEEVLLGACYNNFAPPKSTKMVGRRRAIEVTGAGITGRFNAVCLASDRTTATSSLVRASHASCCGAQSTYPGAGETVGPTDRPKIGGWTHQPPLHSLSSTGGSFTAAPPPPPNPKSPHFHVPCTCCSCMIGSIAVMQSNDVGFDWLGCRSPLLHRSDQMLRCLLRAASTNLRILTVLAWSVPLLWCNQMIWDLIGLVANPRDCIEVIKCSDAYCVQLPQI